MILEQTWSFLTSSWSGQSGIGARLVEHLTYTAIVVLIAFAIAVPLGALIGHTRRGVWLAINATNASRALPTLGLLVLMVLLMGLGLGPAIIVLVVLALPPMLTATYAGVRNVSPVVVDAARGMGVPEWKILLTIELPIAFTVILSGVRSATLQVVSTATVAAYIGLGGLGRFLIDGLALRDYGQMAGGAVLIALLAILCDMLFGIVNRRSRTRSPSLSSSKSRFAEKSKGVQ
ncbi:ABC transporter permease [Rhodococcus sp. NPDC055024]